MPRFQWFALATSVALGFLALSPQPAHAGMGVSLFVDLTYPMPSLNDPNARSALLFINVAISPGWRFAGLTSPVLANAEGDVLYFEFVARSQLNDQLYTLSTIDEGGIASGYGGGFDIHPDTPPGVYDRDPHDLSAPATIEAYAMDNEGNVDSDSVRLSFTVQPPTVPEPASALLLGVGLIIPAGAVWLRRRGAA